MNEHVGHERFQVVAQRPRECERRRFTADELEAMVRANIIDDEERVELIDGEVIAMAAKGRRHEILRNELVMNWARRLPVDVKVAEEPAFRLEIYNEPEPDILVFPETLLVPDVRGPTALLVVEVSDTSVSRDLKVKAPMYAAYGVREYWVIDTVKLETHVHRAPGPEGYSDVHCVSGAEMLTPLLVPGLAVRLSDLRLE